MFFELSDSGLLQVFVEEFSRDNMELPFGEYEAKFEFTEELRSILKGIFITRKYWEVKQNLNSQRSF
ncbi:hypothetical protein SUGI_0774310 [Cryptomeria japonica]|nr:hypothetical protein SUGI_0774310 [Cryptomeria japonica]